MAITRPRTLLLQGTLCAGLGEGAGFTGLEWVRSEFREKLGFEPYPGTFNLRMDVPSLRKARRLLARQPGIRIDPAPGFCAAKCFHVVLDDRVTGAVVIPEVDDYPADKLEVISAVPVRTTLGAGDGDTLVIRVVCL